MTKQSTRLLSLISLVLLVQSNDSEQIQNETLKWEVFDYGLSLCAFPDEFDEATYVVVYQDNLFFYFKDYVVRIDTVRFEENHLRRKEEDNDEDFFIIYGNPAYAYYSWLDGKPTFLTEGRAVAFYQVFGKDRVKTYSLQFDHEKGYEAHNLRFSTTTAG